MEILILFGVILLGISFLPLVIKKLVGIKRTKSNWFYFFVNISSIILFILLIVEFILNLNNHYLVGYKTRNFLVIGFTALLTLHYLLTYYNNKIYKLLVQILIVSSLFLTTLVSTINLSNYEDFLLYENNTFRIEKNWELMGGHNFLPKIYKRIGIFESRHDLEYNEGFQYDYFHEIAKSAIKEYKISETDNTIQVTFIFHDGKEISTVAEK